MRDLPHNERLHALDALRAVAMLLGVALHAMLAYMTFVWPQWAADDASSSVAFDILFWLIHYCRMEVFFVMAGFFACLLLARYGRRGFLRHRLGRIGLPLLLGMVTIVPLCHLVWAIGLNLRQAPDDRVPFIVAYVGWYTSQPILDQLRPWHLWFLEHLLIFYALAIGWLTISSWTPIAHVSALVTGAWAWCCRWGVAAPVIALAIFPLLIIQHGPGVDTQEGPLPPLRILSYYAVFFVAGWMLYRRRDVLPSLARPWLWVTLLLIGLVAGIIAIGRLTSFAESPWPSRFITPVVTASLVFGAIGAFLRLFQRPSRVMRYLSDSAYWVYLVHLPLVVAINILILPLDLGAWPKFTIVIVVSCTIMYLSYHTLVRSTWIGRMLNGPRRPASARPGTAESAASAAGASPASPPPPPDTRTSPSS